MHYLVMPLGSAGDVHPFVGLALELKRRGHEVTLATNGYFADLATQEFQWSRSLGIILLRYTPRYFDRLPSHLKAQFLFAQLWYPGALTSMWYWRPLRRLGS